jgi:hypothetical protein
MQITADDAAFVYARACRSWYGGRARRMLMSQMEELRQGDDPRALRICKLIAEELSKLDAQRREAELRDLATPAIGQEPRLLPESNRA